MDPNRNSLETILKLPTHRLLAAFRSERERTHFVEDGVWACDGKNCVDTRNFIQEVEKRLTPMREELARREHVPRDKTRK
jgi:hypothetical protein